MTGNWGFSDVDIIIGINKINNKAKGIIYGETLKKNGKNRSRAASSTALVVDPKKTEDALRAEADLLSLLDEEDRKANAKASKASKKKARKKKNKKDAAAAKAADSLYGAECMVKVHEFRRHYAKDPMSKIKKPLDSTNMHDLVQEWYANYVDVDQELLFQLLNAAKDMDIKPLLELTSATVASMIIGKTPEEIRETFNLTNSQNIGGG